MPVNLNGDGMCVACINGEHKTPGNGATGAVVAKGKGRQGELCQCPCHLPKSLLAAKKPERRSAPALQTRLTDTAPMMFIDAKS